VQHMHDPDLLASVCATLAIPKATTEAVSSFVLHAPLELLARAALLERVPAESRRLARRRIELLATLYSAEGEPLPAPQATPELSLAEAIDAGDLAGIDGAVVALAATTCPAGIPPLLGDVLVDRLGAAGHANILMALVTRHPSPAGASMLLRGLAREVGKHPDWRVQSTLPAVGSGDLAAACARLDPVGPAPGWGIYPLVARGEEHGVVTALLDAVAADRVAARQTLPRLAAQTMLQGPAEQAPYGWTHCLTLTQGALTAGAAGDRELAVAAAHVASHWSAHGRGTLVPDYVPAPGTLSLGAALAQSPADAATAAWHTDDPGVWTELIARAATAHDAHHVKYTLACLDAARDDPAAERLFRSACAYLAAWWAASPDRTDPLATASR